MKFVNKFFDIIEWIFVSLYQIVHFIFKMIFSVLGWIFACLIIISMLALMTVTFGPFVGLLTLFFIVYYWKKN